MAGRYNVSVDMIDKLADKHDQPLQSLDGRNMVLEWPIYSIYSVSAAVLNHTFPCLITNLDTDLSYKTGKSILGKFRYGCSLQVSYSNRFVSGSRHWYVCHNLGLGQLHYEPDPTFIHNSFFSSIPCSNKLHVKFLTVLFTEIQPQIFFCYFLIKCITFSMLLFCTKHHTISFIFNERV